MNDLDNSGKASEYASRSERSQLRDQFACEAMNVVKWPTGMDANLISVAAHCYRIADAMLKAREE